ncbi:hypothetical protein [Colwellia asteriadis]
MNKKDIQVEQPVNNLSSSVSLQQTLIDKVKPYSFLYLATIGLIICSLFIVTGGAYYFKYKKDIVLISDDLTQVENKLSEQKLLLSALRITNSMLASDNLDSYLLLEKELAIINKKLSLLKSSHQSIYHDWKTKRQAAFNALRHMKSNADRLQNHKQEVLVKVAALKTAVENTQIQVSDSEEQAKWLQFSQTISQFSFLLNKLNIATSPIVFKQLKESFNSLNEYSTPMINLDIEAALAQFNDAFYVSDKNTNNQSETIVSHWQENLQTIVDYNQLLKKQVLVFTGILYDNSSKAEQNISKRQLNYSWDINHALITHMAMVFAALLSVIILLFWLLSRHLKQHLRQYQALELTLYNREDTHQSLGFEEREQQHNLEVDALTLKAEQLAAEKELAELTAISQRKTNALIEKENYGQFYNLALKLLERITLVSSSHQKITSNQHLFQSYQFSKKLVRLIKQASFHRYMQAEGMRLTLSDINIISTTEAVLLNQAAAINKQNNLLKLHVDGNICPEVKVDVNIFTEMLQVFVQLLGDDLSAGQLDVSFKLQDQNNGQQTVLIMGQVFSSKEVRKLPKLLQELQEKSEHYISSELNSYFIALLKCLHGENITAALTEKGYQLSFTLPLAVMLNRNLGENTTAQLTEYLLDKTQTNNTPLAAKAIDVLIGVKSPIQYQKLQQQLQQLGLQVTFVAQAAQQKEYWQSGCYAILFSEFSTSPFIHFIDKGNDCISGSEVIQRGIFGLDITYIKDEDVIFSHWIVDRLSNAVSIEQLMTLLSPWLAEEKTIEQKAESNVDLLTVDNNKAIHQYKSTKSSLQNRQAQLTELPVKELTEPKVNLELYIKNQGSPELAFFMINEYVNNINQLALKLNRALKSNNLVRAKQAIVILQSVSSILSAPNLQQLCKDWQKLLIDPVLNQNRAFIDKLLAKTQQEITDITAYVKSM